MESQLLTNIIRVMPEATSKAQGPAVQELHYYHRRAQLWFEKKRHPESADQKVTDAPAKFFVTAGSRNREGQGERSELHMASFAAARGQTTDWDQSFGDTAAENDYEEAQVPNLTVTEAAISANCPPPNREPRPTAGRARSISTRQGRHPRHHQDNGGGGRSWPSGVASGNSASRIGDAVGSHMWLGQATKKEQGGHSLDYFRGILFFVCCGCTVLGHRDYHVKRLGPGDHRQ